MTGRVVTSSGPAVVAAAVLLLAGCGSSTVEPSAGAGDGAVRDELRVGLTEWAVETGGVTAAVGEVTLQVTNAGGTAHDLVVTGEEGSWRTPVLRTGEQAELVVTTVAGEVLLLDCSLTGHHAQGMWTTLQVEAGP